MSLAWEECFSLEECFSEGCFSLGEECFSLREGCLSLREECFSLG